MARNIEIKAKVSDLAPIRAQTAALASGPAEILHQVDTFFVVAKGRLKVRTFSDGSGELIAYERANEHGARESVYSRVPCHDARRLTDALGSALAVRGVVAKRREVFLIGRTRIHLDEVERLGSFVELEVVLEPAEQAERGRREARDLVRALQIPERAFVAGAYIDLLEEQRTAP